MPPLNTTCRPNGARSRTDSAQATYVSFSRRSAGRPRYCDAISRASCRSVAVSSKKASVKADRTGSSGTAVEQGCSQPSGGMTDKPLQLRAVARPKPLDEGSQRLWRSFSAKPCACAQELTRFGFGRSNEPRWGVPQSNRTPAQLEFPRAAGREVQVLHRILCGQTQGVRGSRGSWRDALASGGRQRAHDRLDRWRSRPEAAHDGADIGTTADPQQFTRTRQAREGLVDRRSRTEAQKRSATDDRTFGLAMGVGEDAVACGMRRALHKSENSIDF